MGFRIEGLRVRVEPAGFRVYNTQRVRFIHHYGIRLQKTVLILYFGA